MKKKFLTVALLVALSLICFALIAGCSSKSSSLNVAQCDFAYLTDVGTGTENAQLISPVKKDKTLAYDVMLHNGYDRDTLKVYADGKLVALNPSADYNADAAFDGFQLAGTVDISGTGESIEVTFECSGKNFDISFAPQEGVTIDSNDERLDMFTIAGKTLSEYINDGEKISLNYVDIKDTWSLPVTGPVHGYCSLGYTSDTTYIFMLDGDMDVSPIPSDAGLTAYTLYIQQVNLMTTAGRTIYVNPEALYINDWGVDIVSGDVITSSVTSTFKANENKTITLTLNMSETYIDYSQVAVYINDTRIEMQGNTYVIDSAQTPPASFLANGSSIAFGDIYYVVRVEGLDVDLSLGTPFAKVSYSAPNPDIKATCGYEQVPDGSGDLISFNDDPFYIVGNEMYYKTNSYVSACVEVNFQNAVRDSVNYLVEVSVAGNNGHTMSGTFNLKDVSFVYDDYYGIRYAELQNGDLSFYAVLVGTGTDTDITAESNYGVCLCFTLAPGMTVTGTFI